VALLTYFYHAHAYSFMNAMHDIDMAIMTVFRYCGKTAKQVIEIFFTAGLG